jgi:hypothetical protein
MPGNSLRFNRAIRIGLAAAFIAFAFPANPHTHVEPDGNAISWYPKECCHDGDCRPVASIKPAYNGLWMTTVDGHTVLIGPNHERRSSRDMRWHICIGLDDIDNQTPRITCIFEPSNS